ncbi:hypothetical protein [Rhizobium leguminosarum]|uniref:Uncharacterized protein n=1 Tax=Rhizobium leguminosarum TaxID=384 RepID=A0A7K3VU10_RHILE|nr:hypothetical protein [Rhizobium leguminosarum]NEK20342.1 hypothetical protein [Rhizobium leguminosarum]
MERAAVTAEHYRRLRPAERVVALRFLRGRLQRQLHIATKISDVERHDSLVAILALVNLALPEAATQSATTTLFLFNEAIVALGGSEGSARSVACNVVKGISRRDGPLVLRFLSEQFRAWRDIPCTSAVIDYAMSDTRLWGPG